MLSFLKRKPEQAPETAAAVPSIAPAPPVRRSQQNIKVSKDCAPTFAAIAEAQEFTKAELFEDLVAERLQQLERQGVKLSIGN
jgi:hypothetical protein